MLYYILVGVAAFLLAFLLFILPRGFFVVQQNERAVKTRFGKAKKLSNANDDRQEILQKLNDEERDRYNFPKLQIITPGGPYFKWPWERVHKVSIATQTANIAYDPESRSANKNNTVLEAITKDQLNIDLSGQIRYRVSDKNIYAYFFGIKKPICHVMGYFVSVLRERIAGFDGKALRTTDDNNDKITATDFLDAASVSINDLRRNLRDLNDHMDAECQVAEGRYGVVLEASLITGIESPQEVESALAAINTAHNQVSSDLSLAHATADQRIVLSKRAVEIATLRAESETEGLVLLAKELDNLKQIGGKDSLNAYVRNAKLSLFDTTQNIYQQQGGNDNE